MNLRQVLQSELIMAMKSQDRATTTVLRSVLGAIANAEAVAVPQETGDPTIGFADVPRKELSPQQIKLVVLDEVEKRRNSIGYYGSAGRHEEAEALEKEVAILERYLYLTG